SPAPPCSPSPPLSRSGHPPHLQHPPSRFHHGHPPLGVALALAHPRLGRLLGDRLVGKQPNPHLPAPLHLPRECDARRLDLPVGDPPPLERHQTVVAERHGVAARGHPLGAALDALAKLDPLRREQRSPPPTSAD